MRDKILLIRPSNIYNYNNYPALNLISLGTVLRAAGFKVKIINCAFYKDALNEIKKEIGDALFAGISILTSEAPDAYRILKFIKENSVVPTIVGGWHCTLFPEQMAASELVDYVICGEGEKNIVEIAESLKNNIKLEAKIFKKEIVDLEALAEPDYFIEENIERFISSYLTDKLSESVRQPMRWLPYETSRGCPSQCTFCINVVTKNNIYRKKSSKKAIVEIEHIVNKYRLTHLKIIDDNFFVDVKRAKEIFQSFIDKKLNITWDAECRCDYFRQNLLNDEVLAMARKSGLVQLTLGIESGSLNTLKKMKKGITPQEAEYAVRQCDKHGIIARSSFILEIPGESIKDIKQTISLINKLRKYRHFTCGVGTFRPYPKCELTEELLKNGYLNEPKKFTEWINEKVIDLYTSAEYVRPWQANGKYSERASYYLNMESMVRLGNHQIDNRIDRVKNSLFMKIACFRNRIKFYSIPFDKNLYRKFLIGFYRNYQNKEKSGSYPLSKLD